MTDVTTETKTPATGAAPDKTTTGSGPDLLGDMSSGDSGGDKGSKPTDTASQGSWPDDWRMRMAGGDEKVAKRLERFTSPDMVTKSWLSSEQKISSGEFKRQLPENATDEQKAEWRKANGIPEAPDKYDLPTWEDFQFGEEDKPMVDAFLSKMHASDASPAQVAAALETYKETVLQAQTARYEADKSFHSQAEDALRADWGNDYRGNIELVKRTLNNTDIIPTDVKDALMTARDGQGNLLRNNPAFLKMWAQIASEVYGDGPIVTGDVKATMASRKDEIERTMKTDFKKYLADGMDKEYAKILEREMGRKGGAPAHYDE
jgi:hypothetical protein